MAQTVGTSLADLPGQPAPRAVAGGLGLLAAMARNRAGLLGFIVFILFVLIAFIGPFFVPQTLPADLKAIYQAPSPQHLLGTDSEGRDIGIQMINGGQSIILVGATAALLSTLISITFGALAAYLGGYVDTLIMLVADVVLTLPQIVLLAVLATFIKLNSPWLLAAIIALLSWPTLLRAVRAQVLSLKEREYVEAARVLDLGTPRILFLEILPNMANFILMNFTIGMTGAIYAQVGLYLLGLAPLAGNNWGIMLNLAWVRGAIFFKQSLLYILAPVLAISLLQLSIVTMTRSLEDIFNPRLRGA
ncbi:MAG TPA: ABC transporter permease [Chloroflexota bacterium]|nr:ABC transporter permease [Chloroflexota bacterium]